MYVAKLCACKPQNVQHRPDLVPASQVMTVGEERDATTDLTLELFEERQHGCCHEVHSGVVKTKETDALLVRIDNKELSLCNREV